MNITLKTIRKVKQAVYQSKIPISANFIAISENIHAYRVKSALNHLVEHKQITHVENSTGIDLYKKK